MLLLLDADFGFLGFIEQGIYTCFVAAFVCMKPQD